MKKKVFLLGFILVSLLVAVMFLKELGTENLKQMESDFGWGLTPGIYDVKAYHYQHGTLVDQIMIYENLEIVEEGALYILEINLDHRQTFNFRAQSHERETNISYQIEMNQDLDWDGGGWLLGEVEREVIIGQERPLVFRAAVDGRYKSVLQIIANMTEFTEFESAFETIDELVIFSITQKS